MSAWIFFDPGLNAFNRPGDPIVEARADLQQHIAAVHRQVGLVGAVHAQHAEELRIARRIAPKTHQSVGHREAAHADEFRSARPRRRARR